MKLLFFGGSKWNYVLVIWPEVHWSASDNHSWCHCVKAALRSLSAKHNWLVVLFETESSKLQDLKDQWLSIHDTHSRSLAYTNVALVGGQQLVNMVHVDHVEEKANCGSFVNLIAIFPTNSNNQFTFEKAFLNFNCSIFIWEFKKVMCNIIFNI